MGKPKGRNEREHMSQCGQRATFNNEADRQSLDHPHEMLQPRRLAPRKFNQEPRKTGREERLKLVGRDHSLLAAARARRIEKSQHYRKRNDESGTQEPMN